MGPADLMRISISFWITALVKEFHNLGGSISRMLEVYGKFNENLIKKYTTQILEGLEYLHSHNIIHTGK
jgi:serine/threonine protein kinase